MSSACAFTRIENIDSKYRFVMASKKYNDSLCNVVFLVLRLCKRLFSNVLHYALSSMCVHD